MRDFGGLPRCELWQHFDVQQLTVAGRWRVLAYRPASTFVVPSGARAHGFVDDRARLDGPRFWTAWELLNDLGLIELVPHLVEGEDSGEIVHTLQWAGDPAIGGDLGRSAHAFAGALVQSTPVEAALLVAVSAHMRAATVVGIARPRYRARTQVASEWFARARADAERLRALWAAEPRGRGAAARISR